MLFYFLFLRCYLWLEISVPPPPLFYFWYLLSHSCSHRYSEHRYIDGFKCLFSINGFSRTRLEMGFPPLLLVENEHCLALPHMQMLDMLNIIIISFLYLLQLKEPKVFIHGNTKNKDVMNKHWPGCS